MVKLTRNKVLFLGLLAVIFLGGIAIAPPAVWAQPPPPQNATFVDTGNGTGIFFRYVYDTIDAVIFEVNVSGTIYDAYCIDIYIQE